MSNAIRCIDQRFAFKNSRISCLALIFKLKNPSTTVLYAKKSVALLQVAKYDDSYTVFFKQLIRTNGLVVNTGCRESGDMGSIPDDCWNALQWPSRADSQWPSRADRAVNLNTTIQLALFWRTWTRARARTRPHMLAWHMGRDYSDCRASELTDSQVSGFVFSWFLENT